MIALASVNTEHSQAGHQVADGDDDRSAAVEDDGDGGATAVLQSEAEDGDAGVELFNAEARRRSFGIFYFPSTDKVSAKLFPRELVVFPTSKSTRPFLPGFLTILRSSPLPESYWAHPAEVAARSRL